MAHRESRQGWIVGRSPAADHGYPRHPPAPSLLEPWLDAAAVLALPRRQGPMGRDGRSDPADGARRRHAQLGPPHAGSAPPALLRGFALPVDGVHEGERRMPACPAVSGGAGILPGVRRGFPLSRQGQPQQSAAPWTAHPRPRADASMLHLIGILRRFHGLAARVTTDASVRIEALTGIPTRPQVPGYSPRRSTDASGDECLISSSVRRPSVSPHQPWADRPSPAPAGD